MKSVNEMTLLEIESLVAAHGKQFLKPHEIEAIKDCLGDMRFIVSSLTTHIHNYEPLHSCPQCASPKKEKEAPIHFSLD